MNIKVIQDQFGKCLRENSEGLVSRSVTLTGALVIAAEFTHNLGGPTIFRGLFTQNAKENKRARVIQRRRTCLYRSEKPDSVCLGECKVQERRVFQRTFKSRGCNHRQRKGRIIRSTIATD